MTTDTDEMDDFRQIARKIGEILHDVLPDDICFALLIADQKGVGYVSNMQRKNVMCHLTKLLFRLATEQDVQCEGDGVDALTELLRELEVGN